ncbi:uracil-DNA glycosylase [Leucobacter komagatae]|uniref:Uracil-DNA glycosylase n=1 Tax=Leucobacter komagatae TaxID=55969 RepID=A0A0D0INS6_9MICO|nr:uracil-DNA glycosylase [Leucobacter komagatae]KIP53209.1 uracil-DNA glycosylase [Leucobacter komagatae]
MTETTLAGLVAGGAIAADWGEALAAADAASGDTGALNDALAGLDVFLAAERAAGVSVLPDPALVFRAFERPLADVRVLIVGQDPYPTPGHAIGLSFATNVAVRPLPRSLKNIFTELDADLGVRDAAEEWSDADFWAAPERTGDLSAWADAGVLLLNRVLTVRAGAAGSHRGRGWETLTELAIRALVNRGGPLVAILWGNDARALAPMLGDTPRIESAHPSPLSASRGFFGSRPFSRANEALSAQGAEPVAWRL